MTKAYSIRIYGRVFNVGFRRYVHRYGLQCNVVGYVENDYDNDCVHIEAEGDTRETIAAIRKTGCTVGISLRPGTAAEAIFPYLDAIDLVLVMTVEPGFGGQKFMADMLDKVRKVRAEIDRRGLAVHVQMDGGIGPANAGLCIEAGGNLFVAGTSVFRAPDAAAAIDAIRNPSK